MSCHIVLVAYKSTNYKYKTKSVVLFNMFLNNLDVGIKSFLSKIAGDPKLGRTVKTREDRDQIRKELDRLESWAGLVNTEHHSVNCKVLHLGKNTQN